MPEIPLAKTASGIPEVTIQEVSKTLNRSGPSGISIHVDKAVAERFRLESGDPVTIQFVEKGGRMFMHTVTEIEYNFGRQEAKEYGDSRGWDLIDESSSDGTWSLTFQAEDVRIIIDSPRWIDKEVTNNVVIEGPPESVKSDFKVYEQLRAIAEEEGFNLRLRDSEGLWQQVLATQGSDMGELPDIDVLRVLSNRASSVSARLVATGNSLDMELEEIGDLVKTMESRMDELSGR